MDRTEDLAHALRVEADWLFRYATGRACSHDARDLYARTLLAGGPAAILHFPKLLRGSPLLMRLCEPLPGRWPEFDRRRMLMLAIAESHPSTVDLYYPQGGRLHVTVSAVVSLLLEGLFMPVRLLVSIILWPSPTSTSS